MRNYIFLEPRTGGPCRYCEISDLKSPRLPHRNRPIGPRPDPQSMHNPLFEYRMDPRKKVHQRSLGSCGPTDVTATARFTLQRSIRNIDCAGLEHYVRTSNPEVLFPVQGGQSKNLQTQTASPALLLPALLGFPNTGPALQNTRFMHLLASRRRDGLQVDSGHRRAAFRKYFYGRLWAIPRLAYVID